MVYVVVGIVVVVVVVGIVVVVVVVVSLVSVGIVDWVLIVQKVSFCSAVSRR
jgi:hypothetical protein